MGGPSSTPAVGPWSCQGSHTQGVLLQSPSWELHPLEDAENLGPQFLLYNTPRLHSLSLAPSTLVALLITPVASQALLGPILLPARLMASPVSQRLSWIQQAESQKQRLWARTGGGQA